MIPLGWVTTIVSSWTYYWSVQESLLSTYTFTSPLLTLLYNRFRFDRPVALVDYVIDVPTDRNELQRTYSPPSPFFSSKFAFFR